MTATPTPFETYRLTAFSGKKVKDAQYSVAVTPLHANESGLPVK